MRIRGIKSFEWDQANKEKNEKKKALKPVPIFKAEAEERNFWHEHDSTEFIDYSQKNRASIDFDSNVEEPVELISIRLPKDMLNKIKAMATKRDVPYQSLIKIILAKKIKDDAA